MRKVALNSFLILGRTMEADLSFFSNSMFPITVVAGIILTVVLSLITQKKQAEEGESISYKPLVRDGILSALFTTMSWTIFPDFMTKTTENLRGLFTQASTKVVLNGGANIGHSAAPAVPTTSALPLSTDIDIHVGPPNF